MGIPVVKIANVKDGNLTMEGCAFVSPAVANQAGRFNLREGDILIALTGYIGNIAIVKNRDLPAVLNQRVGLFSVLDASRLDNSFLFYLLRNPDMRESIEGLGYGSAQPNVSPTLVQNVTTSLPPIPEQRAIAHVLGTLDDKIELNRRMTETLEAMARALFKSWFVDFEPVRAKMEGRWRRGESLPGLPADHYDLFPEKLVDSELGEIPEGWEVGQFSDVATQLRDNENPAMSPDTVFSHFSIPAHDAGKMPIRELGKSIGSSKSRVPRDVVLISKLNPETERVWLVDVVSGERAICSTELLVLRAKPPFQRSYVYCLARSPLFRLQIESLVTGTSKSHQRAPAGAILSLGMTIPSASVIEAFEQSASELLTLSMVCRRESRTLAVQRNSLLPKLVSGKLKVSALDRRPL